MINMGIEKWIKGEQWKSVKAVKDEKPAEGTVHGEREF
jgi:hypothetical protein